jgi:hypothetical protein
MVLSFFYLSTVTEIHFLFSTDDVYRASSFLGDFVLSNDKALAPFQRAYKFEKSLWDFLAAYPGHLQRIQAAMVAWATLQPQQDNLKGM